MPPLVAVLALAVVVATPAATAPSRAPNPALGPEVGAFVQGGLPALESYERWLNRDLRYTTTFTGLDLDRMRSLTGDGGIASGGPSQGGRTVVLTVSMVGPGLPAPKDREGANRRHLRRCVEGEWDRSFFQPMARRLAERNLAEAWPDGRPKVVIRLGHEQSGSWFPWSSFEAEEDYVACWRHIHQVVERVTGPDLRWEWNSSAFGEREQVRAAYPGDEFVDVIGIDFYDNAYELVPRPEPRDEDEHRAVWRSLRRGAGNRDLRTGPAGLDWFVDFASDHDKKLGVSEWGIASQRQGDRWRGGFDNPAFVQNVHEWASGLAEAKRLAYLIYFETNAGDPPHSFHKLSPGRANDEIEVDPLVVKGSQFSKTAALYLRLFGRPLRSDD